MAKPEQRPTRQFEERPAVRESTPLLLGIVGPSGSGKTFSALRLATGIQRVTGGEIFMADSEARRGLHYADRFRRPNGEPGYHHVPFGAPFSPFDYLDVIEYCVRGGAKIIIVDSTSHEHEGPGGVLEMHQDEVQRLMKAWSTTSEDKVKMTAWQKPKAARRRLINTILQMPVHFIFCFRAKEKLKIQKGKDPEPLGFMPISGDEWVYEMTENFLLLPGSQGRPTLKSDYMGEAGIIKVPEQFRHLVTEGVQLSEDLGQKFAEWAAGAAAPKRPNPKELAASYAACSDPATLRALEDHRRAIWNECGKDTRKQLKDAADAAAARIKEAEERAAKESAAPPDGEPSDEPPEDTSRELADFEAGFKPAAT